MDVYEVLVRNELTGETVRTTAEGTCSQQVQVQALIELFKSKGWRKAVALQPERAGV